MQESKFRASLPRARGWTVRITMAQLAEAVSPACARVDPRCSHVDSASRRLSRVRAGGPGFDQRHWKAAWSLPRARGWTDRILDRGIVERVSPACARVDPRRRSPRVRSRRLSRVRAGGPRYYMGPPTFRTFLPCLHGWTEDQSGVDRGARVSPAFARVDPLTRRSISRACGLFRVCAGGPKKDATVLVRDSFLPRARGWAGLGLVGERRLHVSPACARKYPPTRRQDTRTSVCPSYARVDRAIFFAKWIRG